jgi:hypothetical protein
MYIIYAQIGFGTNRQAFNKNIATAEKSPIFTSHKSYKRPLEARLIENTYDIFIIKYYKYGKKKNDFVAE